MMGGYDVRFILNGTRADADNVTADSIGRSWLKKTDCKYPKNKQFTLPLRIS